MAIDWGGFLTLIGISGIIGGILGAYYKPLISDAINRRVLRRNLYRELIYFYEKASFLIKSAAQTDEAAYISPTTISKEGINGDNSILQSQTNAQIWRGGLVEKLIHTDDYIKELAQRLVANNLYDEVQKNPQELRIFYQLEDSAALYDAYRDFLLLPTVSLDPHEYVPSCRLLNQDNARKLAALEFQFDTVKLACRAFEEKENAKELDSTLLRKMRGWKPRGTLFIPFDRISAGHRWCKRCKEFVLPKPPTSTGRFIRYYTERFSGYCTSSFNYYAPLFRVEALSTCTRLYTSFLDIRRLLGMAEERCIKCGAGLLTNEQALERACKPKEKISGTQRASNDQVTQPQVAVTADQIDDIGKFCSLQQRADLTRDAMEALRQALESKDDGIKVKSLTYIAENIGHLDRTDEENIAILNTIATDVHRICVDIREPDNIRLAAIEAYGETLKGTKSDRIYRLIMMLNSDFFDDDYRSAAAEALGKIGNVKANNRLEIVVNSNTNRDEVRRIAMYALARMGASAIKPVIDILNDGERSPHLRYHAAFLLGQIGDQTVLSHLRRAALDENDDIRYFARHALNLLASWG